MASRLATVTEEVMSINEEASYSACVVYPKTAIHLSVGRSGASWLGKHPPLFT